MKFDKHQLNAIKGIEKTYLELKEDNIDVAIYSQSLMGSNWKEYLKEAYRVLDDYRGRLIISEISSGFSEISKVTEKLGFKEIDIEYEKDNRWFVGEWVKG